MSMMPIASDEDVSQCFFPLHFLSTLSEQTYNKLVYLVRYCKAAAVDLTYTCWTCGVSPISRETNTSCVASPNDHRRGTTWVAGCLAYSLYRGVGVRDVQFLGTFNISLFIAFSCFTLRNRRYSRDHIAFRWLAPPLVGASSFARPLCCVSLSGGTSGLPSQSASFPAETLTIPTRRSGPPCSGHSFEHASCRRSILKIGQRFPASGFLWT